MTVVRYEPGRSSIGSKGYRSLIRRAGDHCNRFGARGCPLSNPRGSATVRVARGLAGVDPRLWRSPPTMEC